MKNLIFSLLRFVRSTLKIKNNINTNFIDDPIAITKKGKLSEREIFKLIGRLKSSRKVSVI